MRESEKQLRTMLLDYSPDMVTILEPDGTIRYQSPSSEEVLGHRPDELYGTSVFDMVYPEDYSRVHEKLERILENPGTSSSVELKYRHADGSWRLVEAIANNLIHDPRVEGVMINSRDITNRGTQKENDRQEVQPWQSPEKWHSPSQ